MISKRKHAHTHIQINHHVTIVVDPLENQCMLFAMLLRHNIFSSKIRSIVLHQAAAAAAPLVILFLILFDNV